MSRGKLAVSIIGEDAPAGPGDVRGAALGGARGNAATARPRGAPGDV